MTQKQNMVEDENDNREEFILIRAPKTIDPSTLNGPKIYLNRTDDSIDGNDLPFYYSMNKIQPEKSGDNACYRMDRDSRLKGCLNFYKQSSSSSNQESNECELQPLDSSTCDGPNDPVEMIIHRNKRKSTMTITTTITESKQVRKKSKLKSK
ncbi:hypothetical protein HUG17_2871 [Dermatophagoides farinae]|uniref:Uncharacterized protein n=1 Tax=Dermatophagoides farinae TaxID=6954 RepID=A0A9D4NV04_DERFA|nr:hypothetical protein HUG17_2871 [Dermatophagoides farinae]